LRWHRRGWGAYWSLRSRRQRQRSGRRPIPDELQALIRRMTAENRLWGQKRIQAELARLGFAVSARTVAKYMNSRHSRGPSSGWRKFLKRHESSIWACDFFCVQTFVSDSPCLFCNPAREPGNPARCGNAISDGRMDCPANSGVLRLGSISTAVSDPRS